MDIEDVVHIHRGVSFSSKVNFMKFAGKWMELENILCVVTQADKHKCSMFSLIWGTYLTSNVYLYVGVRVPTGQEA